jgi:hypothetical protein
MNELNNKLNEKRTEASNRTFFALITVPTGERFVGKVSEKAFSHWTLNKSKLIVEEPKRIDAIPVQDKSSGQIVGFSFSITPTYPAKTPQEKMVFDACGVELLEEITEDEDGHQRCEDRSGLFMPYLDMVSQWRNELSEIVLPPNKKIVTTGQLPPDGTIPFKKG